MTSRFAGMLVAGSIVVSSLGFEGLVATPASAQVLLGGLRIYSPTKTVAPVYPEAAAKDDVRGTVSMKVDVGVDGRAKQIEIAKSFDAAARYSLERAAIDAVRQWEFGAGIRAGVRVPYTVVVDVDFPPPGPSAARYETTAAGRITLPPPFATAVPLETEGLTAPSVVRRVEARYTADALRAKVQGDVVVDLVVATDGTVAGARVVKSLDAGLDAEALDAVSDWQFTPGRLNTKAVPVRMTVTLTFRLH